MEVMEVMDTELKTERLQIVIEPSVMKRIDDFRFGNRINSRSEAVRVLMLKALQEKQGEAA